MSENLRPIDPPHTKTCASDDCPCFAEGKQSISDGLAEIRDELMAAMQRVCALLAPEGGQSDERPVWMSAPDHSGEIDMLAAYSAALDEVYALRRALAFEATAVEAHTLDLKALSKNRRHQLAQAVERMRGAARGESDASYAAVNRRSLDREMERAGGSNFLTRASWEASLIGSSEEDDRG